MTEVKEKFRNVTFCVSENLIAEIDSFCKERGGVKRKQWLYDLIENKNAFKLSSINLEKKFESISSDYTKLFIEKERLRVELEEKQKVYSELFTHTLKYRTFYRRLKNLFTKF